MNKIDKNKIIGKSLMFIGIFIIAIAITGFDPIRINQDGDIYLGDPTYLILNPESNPCMYEDINENKSEIFDAPDYIIKNHPSRYLFCNTLINTSYTLNIKNENTGESVILNIRNASESIEFQVKRNGFITFFQWINISNYLDIKQGDELFYEFFNPNLIFPIDIAWSYVFELKGN